MAAQRTWTVLVIVLVVVPLIFAGDTKGDLPPPAARKELQARSPAPGGVGMTMEEPALALGGVGMTTEETALAPGGGQGPGCVEKLLYTGPCVSVACVGACVLEMHIGGHCKGGSLSRGHCYCFVCPSSSAGSHDRRY